MRWENCSNYPPQERGPLLFNWCFGPPLMRAIDWPHNPRSAASQLASRVQTAPWEIQNPTITRKWPTKLFRDSQHRKCVRHGIHYQIKRGTIYSDSRAVFNLFFVSFLFLLFLFVFHFSLFQRRGGHGHASHTLLSVCDLWETICTSVDVRIWLGFYELFFSLSDEAFNKKMWKKAPRSAVFFQCAIASDCVSLQLAVSSSPYYGNIYYAPSILRGTHTHTEHTIFPIAYYLYD